MRILLTTYPHAFLNPGGGEQEFIDLCDYLNEVGVRAHLYGHKSQPLATYDAVVHFSAVGGGEVMLRTVREQGKPVVLLPNLFIDTVPATALPTVAAHLDLADLVVVRTAYERGRFADAFPGSADKIVVVPAGIDPVFDKPVRDPLFEIAYGFEQFVLWVGVIEPSRNQLFAIEALRDLDVPQVFFGAFRDRDYAKRCRAAAGDKVRFLPQVPPRSEILRSAYRDCSIYIEVGLEPPGFSILEAGLSGADVIVNDHPWNREVLGAHAVYVPPGDPDALRAAVVAGLATRPRLGLAARVRERHMQPAVTRMLVECITRLPGRA